ncbi:MAG: hypothetical protein V1800_05640 [Candidatus Latescibacterota bacterium]
MSKRKSPFVRDIKRLERRELWQKKPAKKKGHPIEDVVASDEQAQPMAEAGEMENTEKADRTEETEKMEA